MKLGRISAATVAALAAIGLAACGSGTPGGSSGGGSGHRRRRRQAVKVGIKFDQPGLGLKEGSTYTGFDVDVAKYIAKELGYDARPSSRRPPAPARDAALDRPGQVHRRHLLDHRRPQEEGRLRRPVLHRRPGPARAADDTSITGPDTLAGKKLCSVTGSTSAQNVKDEGPGRQAAGVRHLLRVRRRPQAKNVDALTTDDTILAGFAAQPANKGKFKVVGKTFSEENYGIGLQEGRHRRLREGQRRDQQVVSSTAPGRRRSTPTSARPATSPARATRRSPPPAAVERRHRLSSTTTRGCRPLTRAGGIPRRAVPST